MDEVLNTFAHLIREHRVLTDRHDNRLSEYKSQLTLINGSILEFTEILVHGIQKRKYSYQWMQADYTLILRWDNALHHLHIPTFPHHRHIGDELTVEPSAEMFLNDVLQIIDRQITAL